MSESPTQPPDGNSAFVTAAAVLGVIAIAQVAAVVWFVTTHEPVEDDDGAEAGLPRVSEEAVTQHRQPPDDQTPQISRTHSIANIPTMDPASATPPLIQDQPSDGIGEEVAVENKAALFYLDKGMALRNDGDMQGALVHFNSAASLEKDHPRILYEFAITYEEMGLSDKAANFWKSIYGMGRVRGGDYYALADFRLKGQAPTANTIETAPGPGQKLLEIASAIAEPDDTVAEGERVVLNVLIKSSPQATVNPRYVHVRVDFYDIVNESMVALTRAVPDNRWVTQPVDWQQQAEELLEVTYFLPPQSDQDILDFGHLSYHGYVVKVYYRDELQDVIAEPRTLLDNAESDSGPPHAAPRFDESFFPR